MMRYFNILIAVFILGSNVYSQTDTLSEFFSFTDATLIPSPNGGYVSGTNGYLDEEKLQAFFPSAPAGLIGVWVWFGGKSLPAAGTTARACLKIRDLDETPVSGAPYIKGPSATLDSAFILLSDIDTGSVYPAGLNWIPLTLPLLVTKSFVAGISFSEFLADTAAALAIKSTLPDSIFIGGRSWEKWDGEFYRVIDSWGFDTDFAIFPVIDTTFNGLNKLNRIALTAFPNPSTDFLNLSFPVLNDGGTITIYDSTGRICGTWKQPAKATSAVIPANNLAGGNYVVVISGRNSWGSLPVSIIH